MNSIPDHEEASIWILDFGSQYTQLITRKIRELGYSSTILNLEKAQEKFKQGKTPHCLILSGGPQSIFEDKHDYAYLFKQQIPILGICYGMQLISQYYGGKVEKGEVQEYGHATIYPDPLIADTFPHHLDAWMSHADHLIEVPKEFAVLWKSQNGLIAGIKHQKLPIVGFQFHPEVEHTQEGKTILQYFLRDVANLKEDWDSKSMLDEAHSEVCAIGDHYVLCAFSGGVDSLVAATLSSKILGNKLYCFFVDNGLLRPQDYIHIEKLQKETNLNIEVIDGKKIFLDKLKGIDDPEKKRKTIGLTFIDIFESKVHEFEKDHQIRFEYLLQGTLYPDVIESISPFAGKDKKSVTIKSHHNVGGLPEKMNLKLLEPFKWFFKDEVRQIGIELGLKPEWVFRHPFPGPGLGIRILGEITEEAITAVQRSDQVLFEELHAHGLYDETWQAFTVFLPVKTVGVKGDARAYENVICLRMVSSQDGMTCTWSRMPESFLSKVSSRITNEVAGITRVVYDITSKPPGTIEWE